MHQEKIYRFFKTTIRQNKTDRINCASQKIYLQKSTQ